MMFLEQWMLQELQFNLMKELRQRASNLVIRFLLILINLEIVISLGKKQEKLKVLKQWVSKAKWQESKDLKVAIEEDFSQEVVEDSEEDLEVVSEVALEAAEEVVFKEVVAVAIEDKALIDSNTY